MPHDSNPFATRFTQPGALDFLLPAGESLDGLVARLRAHSWWGQIVGPHGSGKSTLLAALRPRLQAVGREVAMVTMNPAGTGARGAEVRGRGTGDRRQEAGDRTQRAGRGEGGAGERRYNVADDRWLRAAVVVVAVAGEKLVPLARAGLLVTAHSNVGLPMLVRMQPTLELAQRIVRSLLPPGETRITEADLAAAFQRHPDNLREMLFALYDVWRRRGRE